MLCKAQHRTALVTYYSVFRLRQLDEQMVYLYLLCFVYHRYQKLHDNLINCLIYDVRQYLDEAKNTAKERVYECLTEGNENLQKAGQVLKLFTNESIEKDTPFHQVQAKAFSILERQKLDFIADHITRNAQFDETAFQWEHVDKLELKKSLVRNNIVAGFSFSFILPKYRINLFTVANCFFNQFMQNEPNRQRFSFNFP